MIGLWVSWLLMVMVVVSMCGNGSFKKQPACPMEISSIPNQCVKEFFEILEKYFILISKYGGENFF